MVYIKKRKAQGAIEFIILFGAVLFFFVVFFGIVEKNIEEKNKEKEKTLLQSVALNVRDEINLAAESSDGYFREFKIPGNILGRDYQIELINNSVYAHMNGIGFSYKIFQPNGTIQKGANNITKQNGTVFIN